MSPHLRRPLRALPGLALVALGLLAPAARAARLPYPETRVQVVRDTLHGTVIEDPYRWLEAKDAPETRAWLEKQIALTQATLGKVPGRDRIRARLEQLLKVDVVDVPTERGGRYFFAKRLANQEQKVLYVRQGLEGKDEMLLDPHPLSPDRTTSALYYDVASDGSRAAVATRQGGEDEVTISVMDVAAHTTLPDLLPRARYFSVSLQPDHKGLFYARYDKEGSRVFHHAMGDDPAKDELVFGEGRGPEQIIVATLSDDGRWLLLTVYHGASGDKTELWVKDLAAGGPIVPVVNDLDASFSGSIGGDRLFMRTNWQAPKGRVLVADLAHPAREGWKEIVPESESSLEDLSVAGGKLFLTYLENVKSKMKVVDPDGKALGEIAFPAAGSVTGFSGSWNRDEAFFSYKSFHIPTTIYRYDAGTGKQVAWWRSPSPVESDRFALDQVWFASKDGTKIPMFLLYKKGLPRNGRNPVFLTGYGGFTYSYTPSFSAEAVVWAEQGGVYAVPNLRGGSEFGEAWHKAGMLEKKQNVFDDFIGAAEWLIANRWSSPKKLSISGGSNGGLLVGAALTQRPELFQAVVCAVPLLDMLRYQNFLVARFWVPEYGSAENADQFPYLHAYSPYHHVKKGVDYPAVLFVTGDSDTRVDPLHARKMAALLQAATGGERPILLHYDTKSGHSAGKPISKQVEDDSDELLFQMWQLGVTPTGAAAGAAAVGASPR